MRVLPAPSLTALVPLLESQHALVLDATQPGRPVAHWLGAVPAGEEVFAPPFRLPSLADLPADAFDAVSLAPRGCTEEELIAVYRILRPGGIAVWPATVLAESAALIRAGFLVHPGSALARKPATLHPGPAQAAPISPPHRTAGYAVLSGEGLEIGAFNEPAPLPNVERILYFDALDATTARKRFPEIDPARFVEVDVIGDLDQGDLAQFPRDSQDFVVCNHVIEHVANPALLVEDLFRIVRPGGHVVLTVPDKRYTFDHERPLTPLVHLWADYEAKVTMNDDPHYREFIEHVTPHVLAESPENQARHVELCRERREHAHVWDSDHFRRFVDECLTRFSIAAAPAYESVGRDNRLEYFSVWRKLPSA